MKKIILAVLFVIGIYCIYTFVPGVKEAVELATTVKPETFTELYFENHLELPSTSVLGKTVNFAFTVHDLEYKNIVYPYEVYIECLEKGCNGEKQIIDKGSFTLNQDEYKTIPEKYTLTLPTERIQIVVDLINKKQQIDFWTDETNLAVQQPVSEIVQPAVSTELYFNNHPPLPLRVTSNQTIKFAFTVHNFENKDMIYPYEVYMEEGGEVIQIDNGQFSLEQGEYKTIAETYVLKVPVQQAKIFVKLTNENKYVYFKIRGMQ
ncbi:MAG: hypothetical protein ABSC49_03670 [Candidatus Microgenomates bacterium]|jgi:hypothetical protein